MLNLRPFNREMGISNGVWTLTVCGVSAGEGSPLKRGRVETPQHWQAFVQSAAKHYKEWEDSADVENDSTMKFLTVSGDPLLNFPKGYLLGIRECYRDLKKILEDSEAGRCFVTLGTSGIGKSCFSVFWVCHLAANKKKVIWKLHKKFNLLDFSDEAAKFDGQLDESDPKIQEVFRDGDAWLILDGGQTGGIDCACHVQIKNGTMRDFARVSVSQDCIFLFGKRRRSASFWTPLKSIGSSMNKCVYLPKKRQLNIMRC